MALYDVIITTCWLKKKDCQPDNKCYLLPIWVEPLDFSYQLHCILKNKIQTSEISFLPFFPRHEVYQKNPLMVHTQQSSHEMSPSQTMMFIISPSIQLFAGVARIPTLSKFTSFRVFCSLWCCCNKKAVRMLTSGGICCFYDANYVKVNFLSPSKCRSQVLAQKAGWKTCVYFSSSISQRNDSQDTQRGINDGNMWHSSFLLFFQKFSLWVAFKQLSKMCW